MIYDFIEIGTCDFDTVAEKAHKDDVGLCIEPLKFYLDAVKAGPNVIKVNKAVSGKNGKAIIHYIKPEDIEKHKMYPWVKGCNSLNDPHPTIRKMLGEHYDKFAKATEIELVTWGKLINDYNIEKIKYLKIDTEGHEVVILREYLKSCIDNNELLAEEILFEYNSLTNPQDIDPIIEKFKEMGYKGYKLKDDYKLVKQN